jgi:hypothetical protein
LLGGLALLVGDPGEVPLVEVGRPSLALVFGRLGRLPVVLELAAGRRDLVLVVPAGAGAKRAHPSWGFDLVPCRVRHGHRYGKCSGSKGRDDHVWA